MEHCDCGQQSGLYNDTGPIAPHFTVLLSRILHFYNPALFQEILNLQSMHTELFDFSHVCLQEARVLCQSHLLALLMKRHYQQHAGRKQESCSSTEQYSVKVIDFDIFLYKNNWD